MLLLLPQKQKRSLHRRPLRSRQPDNSSCELNTRGGRRWSGDRGFTPAVNFEGIPIRGKMMLLAAASLVAMSAFPSVAQQSMSSQPGANNNGQASPAHPTYPTANTTGRGGGSGTMGATGGADGAAEEVPVLAAEAWAAGPVAALAAAVPAAADNQSARAGRHRRSSSAMRVACVDGLARRPTSASGQTNRSRFGSGRSPRP